MLIVGIKIAQQAVLLWLCRAVKFFFFSLVFLLSLALFTFLGQTLAVITPNQQLGSVLGSGGPCHLLLLMPDGTDAYCDLVATQYSV